MTSAGGIAPIPGSLTHCVGAAMTNMMVQCAALETSYHGVRVNAVAPGVTATAARMKQESIKFSRDENIKFLKENAKDVPLNQKINETKDIADAICWIASEDASFVTGEILVVDGGQSVTTNRYDDYLKDLQS
jgi:NAD(P)-dependent dehydrogenase (short-subunit alcohol dehydrogenase family)